MKSFRKFIAECYEQEELDEEVEVRHDRYMRSHGKKASGGTGSWMFTHKNMGDVDYNDEREVYSAPRGKFSDAKKAAQQWANKHGHSTVYVMEEVELDEMRGGEVVRASAPYRVTFELKNLKGTAWSKTGRSFETKREAEMFIKDKKDNPKYRKMSKVLERGTHYEDTMRDMGGSGNAAPRGTVKKIKNKNVPGENWFAKNLSGTMKIFDNENEAKKFAQMKEETNLEEGYLKYGVDRVPDAYINRMPKSLQDYLLEYEGNRNSEMFAFTKKLKTYEVESLAKAVNKKLDIYSVKYHGSNKTSGPREVYVYEVKK